MREQEIDEDMEKLLGHRERFEDRTERYEQMHRAHHQVQLAGGRSSAIRWVLFGYLLVGVLLGLAVVASIWLDS